MVDTLVQNQCSVASTIEIDADGSPTQELATSADRHVGLKIRERRTMLGLSQQQLAGMLSVTYQQLHKYERGLNRISAGRLYTTAEALAVPVAWFFDGLASVVADTDLPAHRRMALDLGRNSAVIENEKHQDALCQMARALAAQFLRRRTEAE